MAKRKTKRAAPPSQRKFLSLQRAINKLARMNRKTRQHVLRNSNDVFIRQLAAAVKSIRRVPVSSKMKKKLARHRKTLRAFADPRRSLKSKRQILVRQNGGILFELPQMLHPVLSKLLPWMVKDEY